MPVMISPGEIKMFLRWWLMPMFTVTENEEKPLMESRQRFPNNAIQSDLMLKVKRNEDIMNDNYLRDTTAWWRAGRSCWRQSYWFLCSPAFDGQTPPEETHFSPEKQRQLTLDFKRQTHTSMLEYSVTSNKYCRVAFKIFEGMKKHSQEKTFNALWTNMK